MTESVLSKAFKTNGKGSQDIRTPRHVFESLDQAYHFDLDPCGSIEVPGWLGIPEFNLNDGVDGLCESWQGHKSIFINPPWNNIRQWVKKTHNELDQAREMSIVFLVPSRTETRWFHTLLGSPYLHRFWFHKGRIQFEGQDHPYVIGITFFVLRRLEHD